MKVWVTRDDSDCVRFWDSKERMDDEDRGPMDVMHIGFFEAFFGIVPEKGSCKQYEMTLKEIVL